LKNSLEDFETAVSTYAELIVAASSSSLVFQAIDKLFRAGDSVIRAEVIIERMERAREEIKQSKINFVEALPDTETRKMLRELREYGFESLDEQMMNYDLTVSSTDNNPETRDGEESLLLQQVDDGDGDTDAAAAAATFVPETHEYHEFVEDNHPD
jgi:hypothetical protein